MNAGVGCPFNKYLKNEEVALDLVKNFVIQDRKSLDCFKETVGRTIVIKR